MKFHLPCSFFAVFLFQCNQKLIGRILLKFQNILRANDLSVLRFIPYIIYCPVTVQCITAADTRS